MLLLSHDALIAHWQIFPFHYYEERLEAEFCQSISEMNIDAFLKQESRPLDDVSAVLFQTGFSLPAEELRDIVRRIRRFYPSAKLGYLDWFAPTDLRYVSVLIGDIDIYVKKHVLQDKAQYNTPTLGDTNLTDYYARRYSLSYPETLFPVPEAFFSTLVLGPSFSTSPDLLPRHIRLTHVRPPERRTFDVHARIQAPRGTEWYREMRNEANAAVDQLDGTYIVTPRDRVSRRQYFRELADSKVCLSPFGYGEVCIRDFEAIAYGALLAKPNMSHVEVYPDIYKPYETYIPLAWDYSDMKEKLDLLLGDNRRIREITENARQVLYQNVAANPVRHIFETLFSPHNAERASSTAAIQ